MFNVVIVDDQLTSLKIMRQLVHRLSLEKQLTCFTSPIEALECCKQQSCDLLIADLRMPVIDGIDFVRWFRKLPDCADIPVIIVTVAEDRESRYAALAAGATDFLTKPLDHVEFQARCKNLLKLREQQRIIKDRAQWLEERIAVAVHDIAEREREALLHLARASAYRDPYTGNHVRRMAKYCRIIADSLGLIDDFCATLEFAAPLHDIGKIGIPDDILLKTGPLTDAERDVMNGHVDIGYSILGNSSSKYLQMGARIALQHHEWFDGSGYPSGLAGEDIAIEARIVALADAFDALMSQRPYKPAWPLQQTLTYLRDAAGSQFDPRCVNAFFGSLDAILAARHHYQDDSISSASGGTNGGY